MPLEFTYPEIKMINLKVTNALCRGKKCRENYKRNYLEKGTRVLRLKFWNSGGEARVIICQNCIPDILKQIEKVKDEMKKQ